MQSVLAERPITDPILLNWEDFSISNWVFRKMANSVERVLRYLLPTVKVGQFRPDAGSVYIPNWAPDAFGVCGFILELTAGYHQVLCKGWPPVNDWDAFLADNSKRWFETGEIPSPLKESWMRILHTKGTRIEVIKDAPHEYTELLHDLLKICLVADEMMKNIFLAYDVDSEDGTLALLKWIDNFFQRKTLNQDLDKTIALVLPKNLTPQVGMSFRSLTNNVGLWRNLEVEPRWDPLGLSSIRETKDLYILVIPWPYEIESKSFHTIKNPDVDPAEGYGFFGHSPSENKDLLLSHVDKMIDYAEEIAGAVHGVVFPELSMTANVYDALEERLKDRVSFAVTGIENDGANELRLMYSLGDGSGVITGTQKKHHRWKVDRRQITQYGLGKQLSVDNDWWEHTPLDKRSLLFFQINQSVAATALICEDLARQDPVAKLVRTMGPNLVFALLMDGPQLPERWSGRYATVLADDPGSSVLTVTSLGMALKSECRDGVSKPLRNIALWRDAIQGNRKIELKENQGAVLLHTTFERRMQNTADRRAPVPRPVPVLKDVFQISLE